MTEFASYTDLGSYDVSWAEQADEWIHRMLEAFKSRVPNIAGHGLRYGIGTAYDISLRSADSEGDLSSHVLVVVRGDRIHVLIGWVGEQDAALYEALEYAVAAAFDQLGHNHPVHEWSAIVGLLPMHTIDHSVHIARDYKIGPFQLSPGGQPLSELSFLRETPSFIAHGQTTTWPIVVRGSNSGFAWPAASMKAARELNQLCALLSVLWDTTLVVRESPAPLDWGPRSVPRSLPWQRIAEPLEEQPTPRPEVAKTVPSWATESWHRLRTTPKLEHALAAHHEGLRLQSEHPSLALVAYIAAIESICQMVFHDNRCAECSQYRYVSRKFKQVLRLVLDEETADWLGRAYTPRSATVHRGHLHGAERQHGAVMTGLHLPNSAHDFAWRTVMNMAIASRLLLEQGLRGQLPKKSRFVAAENVEPATGTEADHDHTAA